MNKNIIISQIYLENLSLFERFDNKSELEKKLSDIFGKKIKLTENTNEDNLFLDYELITDLSDEDNYCYLNIYYLKTRLDGIYITEITYVKE